MENTTLNTDIYLLYMCIIKSYLITSTGLFFYLNVEVYHHTVACGHTPYILNINIRFEKKFGFISGNQKTPIYLQTF